MALFLPLPLQFTIAYYIWTNNWLGTPLWGWIMDPSLDTNIFSFPIISSERISSMLQQISDKFFHYPKCLMQEQAKVKTSLFHTHICHPWLHSNPLYFMSRTHFFSTTSQKNNNQKFLFFVDHAQSKPLLLWIVVIIIFVTCDVEPFLLTLRLFSASTVPGSTLNRQNEFRSTMTHICFYFTFNVLNLCLLARVSPTTE